jgi:hypothetical protein
MLKTNVFLLATVALLPSLGAQAVYSATKRFNVQVGVAGSAYSLDYGDGHEDGFTLYGDVDFTKHLGVEALYRNASIITPHDTGENHALVGPRYHFDHGIFSPYAKGLVGTGTINFQQGFNAVASSQTYFIYALGGGLDIRATRHINVRAIDFEYQIWPGFKPNGLTPYGASIGAAYRF